MFAGKSIGQVADYFETIIGGLDRKPAIIGHSTGGLLTQILAGRGLAAVSVAIDPAPFRGVLPISALKSGSPVLHNPANRNRAVPTQLPLRNDVREMLSQVRHLPKDAEVLAFEPGCEEYCEREIDEAE